MLSADINTYCVRFWGGQYDKGTVVHSLSERLTGNAIFDCERAKPDQGYQRIYPITCAVKLAVLHRGQSASTIFQAHHNHKVPAHSLLLNVLQRFVWAINLS